MRKMLFALPVILAMGLAFAGSPMTVVLDVENLTCPTCSITIEKALDRVTGVIETHVDTKAGVVTVSYDPADTNKSAVARTVTDAGFPATPRDDDG